MAMERRKDGFWLFASSVEEASQNNNLKDARTNNADGFHDSPQYRSPLCATERFPVSLLPLLKVILLPPEELDIVNHVEQIGVGLLHRS